jgi:hypothetical protein
MTAASPRTVARASISLESPAPAISIIHHVHHSDAIDESDERSAMLDREDGAGDSNE